MKTCTKCGETKDFNEFYKLASSKDGHGYSCKECFGKREKKLRKDPLMQLEKALRSSVITENKMLFKEGKRLCGTCRNIFLLTDLHNMRCKECSTKYKSKYREEHKEKIKKKAKSYYEQNKEKIYESGKKYAEKNKEKADGYKKKYYEQNKEKAKERAKIWKKENKEKVKEHQRQYRLKRKEAIS